MQEVKTPKVSVCVITYNQEKYIRQCLQSIVEQETDFDFEVIVGDDCSTDGTRAIVQEFADRYPERVKPIYQEKNTGGSKNNLDVKKSARGEYISHLDGDDLMLPGKLAKQAAFLDENRNCSFVVHPMRVISEDGSKFLGFTPAKPQPKISSINRLVENYLFFCHSSKMHRRSADIFNYSEDEEIIDFQFHIEHASLGEIGFLKEVLGCYRKIGAGISSATGDRLYYLFQLTFKGFERARQLGVSEKVVNAGMSKYFLGAALLCLRRGDRVGYLKFIEKSRFDGGFIGIPHRILYYMRYLPSVVKVVEQARIVVINRLYWFRQGKN